MFLLSALLPLAMQTAPAMPVQIELIGTAGGCTIQADGTALDEAALPQAARRWALADRQVRLHADIRASYHCIGMVIVALEDAGIHRDGIVRAIDPDRVDLIIAGYDCDARVTQEKAALSLEELRTRASEWARRGAAIHFEPEPMADPGCVAEVRQLLGSIAGLRFAYVADLPPSPPPPVRNP